VLGLHLEQRRANPERVAVRDDAGLVVIACSRSAMNSSNSSSQLARRTARHSSGASASAVAVTESVRVIRVGVREGTLAEDYDHAGQARRLASGTVVGNSTIKRRGRGTFCLWTT
jgi:hypothetical protein